MIAKKRKLRKKSLSFVEGEVLLPPQDVQKLFAKRAYSDLRSERVRGDFCSRNASGADGSRGSSLKKQKENTTPKRGKEDTTSKRERRRQPRRKRSASAERLRNEDEAHEPRSYFASRREDERRRRKRSPSAGRTEPLLYEDEAHEPLLRREDERRRRKRSPSAGRTEPLLYEDEAHEPLAETSMRRLDECSSSLKILDTPPPTKRWKTTSVVLEDQRLSWVRFSLGKIAIFPSKKRTQRLSWVRFLLGKIGLISIVLPLSLASSILFHWWLLEAQLDQAAQNLADEVVSWDGWGKSDKIPGATAVAALANLDGAFPKGRRISPLVEESADEDLADEDRSGRRGFGGRGEYANGFRAICTVWE